MTRGAARREGRKWFQEPTAARWRRQRFNLASWPPPAMEATTSPEDYRRFDGARAIEFYTGPEKIPGPLMLSPTSDWGELAKASAAGAREPMESVTARIDYPGPERSGLPDIHLDFVYRGSVAGPLFDECCKFDETSRELTMRLWRFRVAGSDGRAAEICFRAVVAEMSYGQGRLSGAFTVLDAQPLVEGA